MDVLVDFASTGRIGPLNCGMSLTEAEDLLGAGRPHPAHRMKGPDIGGYPYSWGGLKLVVTRRSVSGIQIHLRPGSASSEASVVREDLIAALDRVRCQHVVNTTLTFGRQSSIVTQPADVCAVFSLPGPDEHVSLRDRHYLDGA